MKIKGMKTMNGIILKSDDKSEISFIFKDNEECLLKIKKDTYNKVKISYLSNNKIVKDEIINKNELSNLGIKYVPKYLLNTYSKLIKNF